MVEVIAPSATQFADYYTQAQSDAKFDTKVSSGLNLVIPTGATNGTVGTNGVVTVGSAVASVTISGVFSATYDNYKILISGGSVASGSPLLNLQLGATTSGYKSNILYTPWNGTPTAQGSASTNRFFGSGVGTTTGLTGEIELLSPFLATNTVYRASYAESTFGGGIASGMLPNTTSYTSFILFPDSSTMTGAKIRIYGYNNGA